MQDSIFTKIIKGEIPCQKIHEDDQVLAFLDIRPITLGHTLVVPKQQIDHLWDLDDELYQHVMMVVKQVGQRMRDKLQPLRVGVQVEGFQVAHAHVHVFPLYEGMITTYTDYFKHVDQDSWPKPEDIQAMAKTLAF